MGSILRRYGLRGLRATYEDVPANLTSMSTDEPPISARQSFQHMPEGMATGDVSTTSSAGRIIPMFSAEQGYPIESSETLGSSGAPHKLTSVHMRGVPHVHGMMRVEGDAGAATPPYSVPTARNSDSSGQTPCTSASDGTNAIPDGAASRQPDNADEDDRRQAPFFAAATNYGTPGFTGMDTSGYDMPATTPGGSKDYNNPANWETSTGMTPVSEGLFSQLLGMETGLGGW